MRRTGAARRLLLSWLVVVAAMAVGDAGPAHGASFTVDATHDAVDAAPGDGVCADATDACTLRAAVMETNALAGADLDLISLPAGTYVLSLAGAGEDASITGDLDISDDLAILGEVSFDGQGDASPVASIISGAEDRVVEVHPSLTAYFLGVRISGGSASAVPVARGGGMANRGRLTLETVRLEENSASEGGGLWIAAGASAHVLHSTITENRAAGIGAGLGAGVLNEGELILESTTVDGNVAEAGPCEDTVAGICPAPSGGGIANLGSGTATNTTISGNSASAGGGIVNYEALELVNVTVTDNSANTGAGVFNARGTGEFSTIVRQRNTIVSAQASGQDCSGPIDSLGHNLDSDGTCGFTGQGDLPNADPLLGPLTDNGGPTQTHALLAGSPPSTRVTTPLVRPQTSAASRARRTATATAALSAMSAPTRPLRLRLPRPPRLRRRPPSPAPCRPPAAEAATAYWRSSSHLLSPPSACSSCQRVASCGTRYSAPPADSSPARSSSPNYAGGVGMHCLG